LQSPSQRRTRIAALRPSMLSEEKRRSTRHYTAVLVTAPHRRERFPLAVGRRAPSLATTCSFSRRCKSCSGWISSGPRRAGFLLPCGSARVSPHRRSPPAAILPRGRPLPQFEATHQQQSNAQRDFHHQIELGGHAGKGVGVRVVAACVARVFQLPRQVGADETLRHAWRRPGHVDARDLRSVRRTIRRTDTCIACWVRRTLLPARVIALDRWKIWRDFCFPRPAKAEHRSHDLAIASDFIRPSYISIILEL
jgi:hypothetical protein